jgi:hypothetical protein
MVGLVATFVLSLGLGAPAAQTVATEPPAAPGQPATAIFTGFPRVKISEGGVERLPEQLKDVEAVGRKCVISQVGQAFYWTSRENVQLARIEAGPFVTYIAVNGVGYVRVTKPEAKATVADMSPTEAQFDYVEHVIVGLRSVTYYGVRR